MGGQRGASAHGRSTVLFTLAVFASTPDHTGLFLGTESKFFIKARTPGTEPKELDSLEAWMMKNPLDDLGPNTLSLISPVDDHIPDRCAVDEIGEDPSKPDELISVPGAEGEIRLPEHFFCVIEGSVLCPGRLAEQPEKLRCIREFAMGVSDNGLEGRRHLVLEYPPD